MNYKFRYHEKQRQSTQPPFGIGGQRMLWGGLIGFFLIGLFLIGDKNPYQSWGRYYMIRPLFVVTLAGAIGGACCSFLDRLGNRFGWNKILIAVLSFVVFMVGLWLGSVLGLDGTYWD